VEYGCQNGSSPGAMKSGIVKIELTRNVSILVMIVNFFIAHTPNPGAYTELFAGLSPKVILEKPGS
jgi:hypothetical protein